MAVGSIALGLQAARQFSLAYVTKFSLSRLASRRHEKVS